MKRMCKILCTLLCVCTLMGCKNTEETKPIEKQSKTSEKANKHSSKTLIVYFSQTGTTRKIASNIASIMEADIFELIPSTPYSQEDVNYNDSASRAVREQSDDSARPSIMNRIDNMDDYTSILLAYPIWFGEAPKIIYTFLESYDLSDKIIVPICTSGSSGITSSENNLHTVTSPSTTWIDGTRFEKDIETSTLKQWVENLHLE